MLGDHPDDKLESEKFSSVESRINWELSDIKLILFYMSLVYNTYVILSLLKLGNK